jgi:hypothetical protein
LARVCATSAAVSALWPFTKLLTSGVSGIFSMPTFASSSWKPVTTPVTPFAFGRRTTNQATNLQLAGLLSGAGLAPAKHMLTHVDVALGFREIAAATLDNPALRPRGVGHASGRVFRVRFDTSLEWHDCLNMLVDD